MSSDVRPVKDGPIGVKRDMSESSSDLGSSYAIALPDLWSDSSVSVTMSGS